MALPELSPLTQFQKYETSVNLISWMQKVILNIFGLLLNFRIFNRF